MSALFDNLVDAKTASNMANGHGNLAAQKQAREITGLVKAAIERGQHRVEYPTGELFPAVMLELREMGYDVVVNQERGAAGYVISW